MNGQDSDLNRRLESIKADALQFAKEMGAWENDRQRALRVWHGDNEDDRARSDELRERLRTLMVDLALAMGRSPLINKRDIRDLARSGRRMCAALRFEEYTGSILRRGEPIRAVEAQWVLEHGFAAMAEWIALLLPDTVRDSGTATAAGESS